MTHIRNKAIDRAFHKSAGLASSIVSNFTPRTFRAKRAGRRADKERAILKRARAFDKAPSFVGGKPTPAHKARSLAEDVRSRHKRK